MGSLLWLLVLQLAGAMQPSEGGQARPDSPIRTMTVLEQVSLSAWAHIRAGQDWARLVVPEGMLILVKAISCNRELTGSSTVWDVLLFKSVQYSIIISPAC